MTITLPKRRNEEEAPQQQAAPSSQQQLAQKVGNASNAIGAAEKSYTGLATPVIAGRAIAEAQQAPHRLQAALKAKNIPQTALQAPQSTNAPATAFDMLKQHNPEIGAFFEDQFKKGKTPFEAAAAARKKPVLKNPIEKLEYENAQPFEGVIAQIFGGYGQQQEITPTQNIPAQSTDISQDLKLLGNMIQGFYHSKGMK